MEEPSKTPTPLPFFAPKTLEQQFRQAAADGNWKQLIELQLENPQLNTMEVGGASQANALDFAIYHGQKKTPTKQITDQNYILTIVLLLAIGLKSNKQTTPIISEELSQQSMETLDKYEESWIREHTKKTQALSPTELPKELFVNFRQQLHNADLLNQFPPNSTLNVLDIACGHLPCVGELEDYFSQRNIKINFTGVDIDPSRIEKARKRCETRKNVRLHCFDATNIPNFLEAGMTARSFDLVVMRHGEINSVERQQQIAKIINHVIPFFVSDSSVVILTFYYLRELCAFQQRSFQYKPLGSLETPTLGTQIDLDKKFVSTTPPGHSKQIHDQFACFLKTLPDPEKDCYFLRAMQHSLLAPASTKSDRLQDEKDSETQVRYPKLLALIPICKTNIASKETIASPTEEQSNQQSPNRVQKR